MIDFKSGMNADEFIVLLEKLIDAKIDHALAGKEVGADGYRRSTTGEAKEVKKWTEQLKGFLQHG